MLEVYHVKSGMIRFVDENNKRIALIDDGVYLCQRLRDTARIGETIEFSPYGSEKTYTVVCGRRYCAWNRGALQSRSDELYRAQPRACNSQSSRPSVIRTSASC